LISITPYNLIRHELIGLNVKIVRDSNSCNLNLSGTVVDETRNTLTIMQDSVQKMISKNNALFQFSLPTQDVQVKGLSLLGRPEDRVKKTIKRRW